MECYFAVRQIKKTIFILDQEDSKHIIKVLRHEINDQVTVIFNAKKYLTKIISFTPVVSCQVIKELVSNSELNIKVTLVMALLKEQKFDLVIQKAVELGVDRIVPIQLSNSVSVVEANSNRAQNKVQRWQKIAKAAAKQANRNIIPEVCTIIHDLKMLLQYQSELNLVAYENATMMSWGAQIQNAKSVTLIVGPEGGFSSTELEYFASLKFATISLGKTILRAETAPLYFLAVVNYLSLV